MSVFFAFLAIGIPIVCKKYPVHKIPRRGANPELNRTRSRSVEFQSGACYSVSTKDKSVSVNASKPVTRMKSISMTIKNTPTELSLIKIPMSFLLERITRITNSTNAQWALENLVKEGSWNGVGFIPVIHA